MRGRKKEIMIKFLDFLSNNDDPDLYMRRKINELFSKNNKEKEK